MNRREAMAYLTRCADEDGKHWWSGCEYPQDKCRTCSGTNDAGHLGTPGSRYGRNASDCAPVAYRLAYIWAKESGEPLDENMLDGAMSLVVNDSDGPEETIRQYPHPERYL